MYLTVSTHRGQKRESDSMDLEFQVVVNVPTWMLGNKLRFSSAPVSTLNG